MKTVLVAGLTRSGTSMVMGLLNILGVHTPPSSARTFLHPTGHYEVQGNTNLFREMRKDFYDNMTLEEADKKYGGKFQAMGTLKREPAWAIKIRAGYYLPLFQKYLDNPHIIAVYREPVERTLSKIKHLEESAKILDTIRKKKAVGFEYTEATFTEGLIITTENQALMARGLNSVSCPTMFTSYKWLKEKTMEQVERMASFLDLEVKNARRLSSFVKPDYSTIKEEKKNARF